jgi:predicted metalloenzyme YecM
MAKVKTKIIQIECETEQNNTNLRAGVKRVLDEVSNELIRVRSIYVFEAQAPEAKGKRKSVASVTP